MKKINIFVWFISFLLIITSCGKEEDKEPTPKERLTAHAWIVSSTNTSISLPGFGELPQDQAGNFDPTADLEGQKIVFNADGTFTAGEGTNAQTGNWTLSDEGKTLVFSGLAQGDLTDFIDAQTLVKLQTFEVTTLTESNLAIQNSNQVPIPNELVEAITGFNPPFPISATVALQLSFVKE